MGLLDRFNRGMQAVETGLLGNAASYNPALSQYLSPGVLQRANQDARMQLGLAMLAASESGMGTGQGLMMAQQMAGQAFRQPMEQDLQSNMQIQALEKIKEQREQEKQFGAFMQTLPEEQRAQLQALPKPVAYQIVAELMTKSGAKPTDDIEEYQYALKQGYKGTLQDWILTGKKAGATNVSQSVGLPGGVDPKQASQAAIDRLAAAHKSGMGAAGRISTANNIRAFLDEGALAGFGSSVGLTLARAGSLVSESAEGLAAKTEALRASLSDATLWAYERLKGTGQVTEKEMELLQKASAGDPTITKQAMYQVADLIERAGRLDIDQSRAITEALLSEDSLKPLSTAFQIRSPDPYKKPVKLDDGRTIEAKRGSDGKYYYTDPATKRRYRVEE